MRMVKTITDSVTALFPVLLLCYWSQEVVFESQQVAKAAVEGNFAGADLRFQKSLNLITARSQRPIQLKAGKIIEISLPTFVAVRIKHTNKQLKPSFWLFLFLDCENFIFGVYGLEKS